MIKKIILTGAVSINLMAFQFDIVGGLMNAGKEVFSMDGEASSINVDRDCKKPFESYDLNLEGLFSTLGMYGISNSSKIVGFLNNGSTGGNTISQEDFKKLANELSKNYLWIPLEVEKLYGEKIYEDRIKSGDVILKNNRNPKYKKMYKKIDKYMAKYNKYLKDNNLSYPYDIKVYILAKTKTAESLPYGYIFISEDYFDNDMYETVLSHELSHISKRHPTKEIQYRLISTHDSITEIGKIIKNMQDKDVNQKLSMGLMTTELIKKSFEIYSQEQELEADSCGLKTINGFIPNKIDKHTKNYIYNVEQCQYQSSIEDNNLKEHPEKEIRIKNINRVSSELI